MRKYHTNDGTLSVIEETPVLEVGSLLKEHDPKLIIEFGTHHGGFTKHFAKWFPTIPIYSIDICWQISRKDEEWFRENTNVTFMIMDMFKKEWLISSLLSIPIRKLLFCDNGKKEKELRLYAPLLREGDILGVHDWDTEVSWENVKHIFREFEPHPINKKFSEPGYTELRFWIKRGHPWEGGYRLPNDFSED